MSASTESTSYEASCFEPLELRLGREHVDAVEGLLARRRGLRFDGELGLGAWAKLLRALRDRLAAAAQTRRDEVLREARIRLRSPVPGEASAGAFLVAALSSGPVDKATSLVGTRRDASPVLQGLRVAAELRSEAGPLDSAMDLDVWSFAGLASSDAVAARMKGGDLRGASIAWARGVDGALAFRRELERAASADDSVAPIALYALARALGAEFPHWIEAHPEVCQVAGSEVTLAVFGDATTASMITLRGHAGIRAIGWLGVPAALKALVPLLERGSPESLVRSVATALFITSGSWFVAGGVAALRAAGAVDGDPGAAQAWLREHLACKESARYHLGLALDRDWPARDEPMSRRWLRAQVGLRTSDAPTARELPDAVLAEPLPPRLAPTDLSFLPAPPWSFEA